MTVCCSNAIVSSSDPCCAERWAMWRNPLQKSLRIMDTEWNNVTSGAVEKVNGKTWNVTLTAKDIIWEPDIKSSVYTGNWRTEYVETVTQWSNKLITSGAVYTYGTSLQSAISDIQQKIIDLKAGVLDTEDIDKTINWWSTDSRIPSSKAVYNLFSNASMRTFVWDWAAVVTELSWTSYQISVKHASKDASENWYWTCRLSTVDDYLSSSSEAALTPDIIRPIIDDLDERITQLEYKIEDLKWELDNLKEEYDTKIKQLEDKNIEFESRIKALEEKTNP